MDADARWHFLADGRRQGPVTAGVLRNLVRAGVVPSDGMVQSPAGDWLSAAAVPDAAGPALPLRAAPRPAAAPDPVETGGPGRSCAAAAVLLVAVPVAVLLAAMQIWPEAAVAGAVSGLGVLLLRLGSRTPAGTVPGPTGPATVRSTSLPRAAADPGSDEPDLPRRACAAAASVLVAFPVSALLAATGHWVEAGVGVVGIGVGVLLLRLGRPRGPDPGPPAGGSRPPELP